jgi:hypothetical protein
MRIAILTGFRTDSFVSVLAFAVEVAVRLAATKSVAIRNAEIFLNIFDTYKTNEIPSLVTLSMICLGQF